MRRTSGLRSPSSVIVLAAVWLALAAPGQAEEHRFELTPFAAYRMGGDFDDDETGDDFDLEDSGAAGLIFNIATREEGEWELLYTRQSTDLDTESAPDAPPSIDMDVEYLHLGGTYLFDGDNAKPFIALTLGVTRFDPSFGDLDSESYFSASFGAGLKVDATEQLGVRLEGRVYTTLLDSDSNIFCSSNFGVGECIIEASGTTLTQWEARAGLIFRF